MTRVPVLTLSGVLAVCVGCADLGYTTRVLHRVPSPDRETVAVCQEVPVFDGPEFDVRLERPDGHVVRELYHMGDGGGCDEVVWAADGRLLAVLTGHVASITVVDVASALAHPQARATESFVRTFDFSSESALRRGSHLTFTSALELEFDTCEYSLSTTHRGKTPCSPPVRRHSLKVPVPLVTGMAP